MATVLALLGAANLFVGLIVMAQVGRTLVLICELIDTLRIVGPLPSPTRKEEG